MDELKLETSAICDIASLHPDGIKARIVPEQIEEVIGGWANLYLANTLQSQTDRLTIPTTDMVASAAVPRERILEEIQYCAGIDPERSLLTLQAVKGAIRSELLRLEATETGKEFKWPPLGTFSVDSFNDSALKMTYIDPAAGLRAFDDGKGDVQGEIIATMLHISDLHFGPKLTTDEGWFKRILAHVPYVRGVYGHSYQAAHALAIALRGIIQQRDQKHIPTCVVFTGDLTASGRPDEFIIGNTYLHKAHVRGGYDVGLNLGDTRSEISKTGASLGLFMVPGNHDIWQRNDPENLAEYQGSFPKDYPAECVIRTTGLTIKLYGLDSTRNTKLRHRLAVGRLTEPQLVGLTSSLTGFNSRLNIRHKVEDALNIVCLHHPLCDPEGASELDDAQTIGRRFYNERVDLVLAGHVHRRFLVDRNIGEFPRPPQVVTGTPTQQWEEKRSFDVLEFRLDRAAEIIRVRVTPWDYNRDEKEFVPNTSDAKTLRLPNRHPRLTTSTSVLPAGFDDPNEGWGSY